MQVTCHKFEAADKEWLAPVWNGIFPEVKKPGRQKGPHRLSKPLNAKENQRGTIHVITSINWRHILIRPTTSLALLHSSKPRRFSPDKAQAHYIWHSSSISNIYHLRQWSSALPNNPMSPILHNSRRNVRSAYVSIVTLITDTWIWLLLSLAVAARDQNTSCL